MRQPLLRGAGVQFNRIAGPGAQPGVYNGVMLARINTDIALADFEASVRNLVADVETAYWELYFDYRALDAVIAGRESALVDLAAGFTPCTKHGRQGRRGRQRSPGPRTLLPLPHLRRTSRSAPCTTPRRNCAT